MVLIALPLLIVAASPDCRLADAAIERYVARIAREREGHEHCQFRRYDALGDVDGDGRDDLVMTFNVEGVEGSNNGTEAYLVVFLAGAKSVDAAPRILFGARGGRMPEWISVDRRDITVHTTEYDEGDAMCCPSAVGQARFKLVDGKLVEQDDSPRPGAAD